MRLPSRAERENRTRSMHRISPAAGPCGNCFGQWFVTFRLLEGLSGNLTGPRLCEQLSLAELVRSTVGRIGSQFAPAQACMPTKPNISHRHWPARHSVGSVERIGLPHCGPLPGAAIDVDGMRGRIDYQCYVLPASSHIFALCSTHLNVLFGQFNSTAKSGAVLMNPAVCDSLATRLLLTNATSGARTVSGSRASREPGCRCRLCLPSSASRAQRSAW